MRLGAAIVLVMSVGCGREPVFRVDLPPVGVGDVRPVEVVAQVDRTTQVTIPQVDVLFVVDNSCSMEEEQALLAENFPAFLRWFLESELDYHIGVVSTDMQDPLQAGRLQKSIAGDKWIEPETAAPEAAFAQMVALGVEGSGREEGRAAAFTAIEVLAQTENAGFIREGAGLHLTVVSDEDDASTDSPISRAEFVDYLQNVRFGRGKVSFSSIVGPVTGCADIGTPGTDYLAVTNQVGGVTWPICEPEWTQVLDELGFIAVGLSKEFFLSQRPVPETIEVSVEQDGTVQPFTSSEWTYNAPRNSITFVDYLPAELAVVEIRYDVLASAPATERD